MTNHRTIFLRGNNCGIHCKGFENKTDVSCKIVAVSENVEMVVKCFDSKLSQGCCLRKKIGSPSGS